MFVFSQVSSSNKIILSFFIFLVLLFFKKDSFSQYDSLHFIPPLYSKSSSANDVGHHVLFLSTNETSPINVSVKLSNGTILANKIISATSPDSVYLGYQYGATGVIDSSQLNKVILDEGIIASSTGNFFANIRNSSTAQGISLTSKGQFGLGTEFRSGHLYNLKTGGADALKSHMVSFMATEDSTVVNISDIKPGVIFYGTQLTGTTSSNISVTLNKYESYVIAAHTDEPLAISNDTAVNGTLITSSNPIVVNSGSWCGGYSSAGSGARDAGVDQIAGKTKIGKEYIVSKRLSTLPSFTEKVLIVSNTDSTEVYINGNTSPESILNKGEYIFLDHRLYDVNDIMFIRSTENVFVYQNSNGSPINGNAQGLNFIPPLACYGMKQVNIPFVNYLGGSGIDILAKTGAIVSVNGTPIPLVPLPVTGNPNYELYKLNANPGTGIHYNISSNENINVSLLSNSGNRGALGYFSGFSSFKVDIETNTVNGTGKNTIEGCSNGYIIIGKHISELLSEKKFRFVLSGTAINGTDYDQIPDSVVIPTNVLQDTIFIRPKSDSLIEGREILIVTIISENDCDTVSYCDTLWISDYTPMELKIETKTNNICFEKNESTLLTALVTEGIGPYKYIWMPSGDTTQSITVSPDQTTTYSVSVVDNCGLEISKSILIYSQCPIKPVNVFSPNGDGINDFLSFDNLEDYEKVSILIYNRWGNLVFESNDYDNLWDGGNLSEGVYFYILTPFIDQPGRSKSTFDITHIKSSFHLFR